MSILVYDGLRELIKREFIDRNMATTDATVDSATNLIRTVMEDYRGKALQLVGTTLPSTGVPGTIYLQSKSEPNEKNRFIAYAYEGGKFVQVGSSFFPEDFAPDSELNINSQVTVENRVLKSAIDDKFNLSGVINNVIPTEPNSVHAKDTPTSAAIQAELATKLGYEDGSRITQEQLWEIFRPELTRPVYPWISIGIPVANPSGYSWSHRNYATRLGGQYLFTNIKYKSGQDNVRYDRTAERTFIDIVSNREISVRITATDQYNGAPWVGEQFFGNDDYLNEYVFADYGRWTWWLTFKFLDPISVGLLNMLKINLKAHISGTALTISTKVSDTGKDNTYTTIQDSVSYDTLYTDGIPFYGFDKRS